MLEIKSIKTLEDAQAFVKRKNLSTIDFPNCFGVRNVFIAIVGTKDAAGYTAFLKEFNKRNPQLLHRKGGKGGKVRILRILALTNILSY